MRIGSCRGNLSLSNHAFHRPNRRKGQDHRHGFYEALQETNHDLKLAECDVVVVETGQKEDVLSRNDIDGCKASNFDIVRAIGELSPLRGMKGEAIWVLLRHVSCQRLTSLGGNDLISNGLPLSSLLIVHDALGSVRVVVLDTVIAQ